MSNKLTPFLLLLVFFLLCVRHPLAADDLDTEPSQTMEEETAEPRVISKSGANLDMKLVYGQFNTMLSTINLTQEDRDFVYLISSYFKRTNDFGYKSGIYENSSYYENKIGFTGNLNLSEKWRGILEMDLDNDSRGMFDNPVYSREEKEKFKLSVKNVVKLSRSFESYFTLGGAQYVHRLRPVGSDDSENSRLNQVNVNFGGEYIWSATNGIKYRAQMYYYNYGHEEVDNDLFFQGEVVDDFHLTRSIGISLGANLNYNRDDDIFAGPIAGFSIKDFRYASIVFLYRYDMTPFRPENYYLRQKYIMPTYDLPPGRVHRGDMRCEFRMNDFFHVLAQFMVDRNNNYYNYYPVTGNVLSASTVEAVLYRSRLDVNLFLFRRMVESSLSYEFAHYDAEEYITYSPNHTLMLALKYNGTRWTFEWNNRYHGNVYTDPSGEEQLDDVIVGDFGIQRKMLESFFAYIKIENLYNYRYYLRDGYPEPGLTVLGGIRILI